MLLRGLRSDPSFDLHAVCPETGGGAPDVDFLRHRHYIRDVRKLIALTVAGWMLAMAPCAALALCASPQAKSCCCAKAEGCCCREAQQRETAPTPATPVTSASLDQPAEATVAANVGLAALASAAALGQGLNASAQTPARIYVTSCTFRC